MALFKVEEIINGNTIRINPSWKQGNRTGNKVIIRGYSLMFSPKITKKFTEESQIKLAKDVATQRLKTLLIDKYVQLKLGINETSDCFNEDESIKCRVYLNDVEISFYFPDFN